MDWKEARRCKNCRREYTPKRKDQMYCCKGCGYDRRKLEKEKSKQC